VADIDPTASGATPNGPGPDAAASEPETPDAPAPDALVEPVTVATPPEESEFLQSLVVAMRGVAEEERTVSVSELRRSVDERIVTLEARAKERTEELRRKTDLDVSGIGDWAKGEIERINTESARKVEARRQQLEQQLADHDTRSTTEVASVRDRVAAYERELDAFFTQLGEISDPASFVAAARRMPKPPSLETGTPTPVAAAPATPTASLNARLAQLGIDRKGAPITTPAASADGEARTGGAAAETPVVPEATAVTEAPAPEAPTVPASDAGHLAPDGGRDAQLAERLAELDARPAPSTATTQTGTGEDADEIATAIMVKGLGSFGAITSFKQRLERLATVRSVTLSLGPTGEFVYRATHPRQIDLAGAITTLEPGSSVDRQADGSLRVTVQPR
jgi:hypothetical protein